VDGAIHRKGGPAILEACRKIRKTQFPDGLPTGQAVVTEAGRLPSRYVIHTVGPVWRGGASGEAELLASAYRESMKKAAELKAERVVFPAISTGVYGYPQDKAANIAFTTVEEFLAEQNYPKRVTLIFFVRGDADAFLKAL
jgi:O-acetyl-ADP-ribose deacetylase (regulator of RNase III)